MLLAKLGIKIDKQSSFRWWKKFLKTAALIISIIINLLATFTWQKLKGGVPTILALKENHKDVQIEMKCNPCKPCSFTALAYIASIAMFGNYEQNNNACGVFELNKSYFIKISSLKAYWDNRPHSGSLPLCSDNRLYQPYSLTSTK